MDTEDFSRSCALSLSLLLLAACGLIYCNLPLAVAGLAVVLLHGMPCSSFINIWVITQSAYTLMQPFFPLPFFFRPNKRTKSYFLFVSIVFLLFQVAWMIFGSVLLSWQEDGVACHEINPPSWIVMLVQIIFGFLGLLQALGMIFDASSVEVDTIEYQEVGGGGRDL